MAHDFDPGYCAPVFQQLVRDYPDEQVYPFKDFRTEWGPIFHRGRLDGSARILVIGQDPATHENIARRILVGEAGQRVQGFLKKLGIVKSYAMINASLYSMYNQTAAGPLLKDAKIVADRNAWFDTLLAPGSAITAVVALGKHADAAWKAWPGHAIAPVEYVEIMHPTADKHPPTTEAKLLTNWNQGLKKIAPKIVPDAAVALVPYASKFAPGDLVEIPERDLPAGTPSWMRELDAWATRTDPSPPLPTPAENALWKRGHLLVTIPSSALK